MLAVRKPSIKFYEGLPIFLFGVVVGMLVMAMLV